MDWKEFLSLVRNGTTPNGETYSDREINAMLHLSMAIGFHLGRANLGDLHSKQIITDWFNHPQGLTGTATKGGTPLAYNIGPVDLMPFDAIGMVLHDSHSIASFCDLGTVWDMYGHPVSEEFPED